jgi:hypothetical protein
MRWLGEYPAWGPVSAKTETSRFLVDTASCLLFPLWRVATIWTRAPPAAETWNARDNLTVSNACQLAIPLHQVGFLKLQVGPIHGGNNDSCALEL